MGMYTELYMSASLRPSTPTLVTDVILYMFNRDTEEPEELPEHPFFECQRWDMLGSCSSYNFSAFALSKAIADEIGRAVYFTTRSDLKNYDDEIALFIDFIKPYIEDDGHIGHYRYEEDEEPTLIYTKELQTNEM
jgi:hypothetical protein